MFKLDQIVFEDKSYVEYMSYVAGRDCSFLGVLERSDSDHITFRKSIPDTSD